MSQRSRLQRCFGAAHSNQTGVPGWRHYSFDLALGVGFLGLGLGCRIGSPFASLRSISGGMRFPAWFKPG